MGGQEVQLTGPDFASGVDVSQIPEGGKLLGHTQGEAVVLVRVGDTVFAVGANCTHYGGPLAEGVVEGEQIRCPWHHARFDLRTGEPMAPALNPVTCWRVERTGDRVLVRAKDATRPTVRLQSGLPDAVVVVGAGGAGNATVETLRRHGYMGAITMVGAEPTVPVDRPNVSKDYLAGTAPEEWIPLRPQTFYEERRITLELGVRVTSIDPEKKTIELSNGKTRPYAALVLATGAEAVRLSVPGADSPHVHTLRSLADSKAIIEQSKDKKRAVVVGASFIGLEAAASLRARGLEVDVVAPEQEPLERVMGKAVGGFVRRLHESKGVSFHLGETVASIDAKNVTLASGAKLAADIVVVGIGVKPCTALAEAAGLDVERGVVVDEFFRTSRRGIWAVGDIARYPDTRSGRKIRVEHWVAAERQGEAAARAIVGRKQPFTHVPFFWSAHYDVTLSYVGHAETFDAVEVQGDLEARDAVVVLRDAGKVRAVVTVGRDAVSLRVEAAMERGDEAELERLLRA